jgi:hypothetical protein
VQRAADLGGRVTGHGAEKHVHAGVFRWPTRRQRWRSSQRRGDRGWAVRGGSTPLPAFQRPHRARRGTNSPTRCESSTNTSNATGTGVQSLVVATVEMISTRGRSGGLLRRRPAIGAVLIDGVEMLVHQAKREQPVLRDGPAGRLAKPRLRSAELGCNADRVGAAWRRGLRRLKSGSGWWC